MAAIKELGAQSWCYRNFKEPIKFIEQLKKTGLSMTELCGVQADFTKPETFASVIKIFKDQGVKIASIGVQNMTNQPAERNYFEFCKQVGCKFMGVTFKPDGMWDAFRTAEKLAEEYDIKLAIHNHGGYDWLGTTVMLDYIFRHTGPRIGLCLDTAWAIDAKQDPIAMVKKFADRLYGVHIKDFVYTPQRQPQDVIVGTGNLDLPKLLSTLQQVNFSGYTVLEYESDADNPVPALTQCVEAVKKAGGGCGCCC